MKRIGTIVLLVGIVIAAVYTLLEMSSSDAPLSDPWNEVPLSTAIVLAFPEPEKAWSELANQSQVWKAFRSQPVVNELHDVLACAFSAPQRESAMEQFQDMPLLIALDRVDAKETSALAILSAKEEIDRSKLIDLLGCMDPDLIKDAEKLDDDNYTVTLDSTIGNMYVRIAGNLLLIASETELLNRSATDSTFNDLVAVQRVRATLGKGADAHVVMNTALAERYFDVFLKPEKQRLIDMPDGYAALDLQVRPADLLVSGILDSDDPDEIGNLGQYGGPNRPAQMVGENASYLYNIHINNALEFTERAISKNTRLAQKLDTFKDSLYVDMQSTLSSWISGEIVIAYDSKKPDIRWTTARAIDGITATRAFDGLFEAYAAVGAAVTRNAANEKIHYSFPEPLPLEIFGDAFADLDADEVGIYEDLVIFGATSATVKRSLNALANERTLHNELRAVVQFDDISEEHSTLIWCDLARSRALTNAFIDVENAKGDTSTLDQLGALSMMIGHAHNGFHHIAMRLQHAPIEQRAEPSVLWRTPLTASVTRKPDILDDHSTKGKSILVQDTQGEIHYLSGTGEQLWTRSIEHPILGGVHQVDRYKNGKLQMLFNTKTHIHLIDIKGNDVEGFPIAIKAETLAPMALLDYDADRNYRLVVSDKQGSLFNYDLEGKAVAWNPIQLEAPSEHMLHHVRVKTKDYLLAVEQTGKVHLLDRKGQPRFKSKLQLAGIASNAIQVSTAMSIEGSGVQWTDTLGQVWNGTFDGELENIAPQRWNTFMNTVTALDDDGILDVITVSKDSVFVRSSKNGITSFTLSANAITAPTVFNFGKGKKRIGIATDEEEGIYLFDLNGSLIKGMPKEGASAFSISDLNSDGKLELVAITATNEIIATLCP